MAQQQDFVDFSGLSVYIQERILQKMKFQSYARFLQTGKFAEALDQRNQKFKYFMDADEISILENYVYVKNGAEWARLAYEQCEKMRFPAVDVSVGAFLTKEACNFLLKLGEIPLLTMLFPEVGQAHVAEFLKKANIGTLKIKTLHDKYFQGLQFPYETSNIDNVEVDYCKPLIDHNVFSINAARHLSLRNIRITSSVFFAYVKEKTSEDRVIDLTIKDFEITQSDIKEITIFLKVWGVDMGNYTFAFTRKNSKKPFMTIEVKESSIEFRSC